MPSVITVGCGLGVVFQQPASGPILIVSSEGLILVVCSCIKPPPVHEGILHFVSLVEGCRQVRIEFADPRTGKGAAADCELAINRDALIDRSRRISLARPHLHTSSAHSAGTW